MFPNLRAELARKNLKGKDVAAKLGINEKTFSNKMTGRSEFTLSEMLKIRNLFFKDKTLEYLFESEDKCTA